MSKVATIRGEIDPAYHRCLDCGAKPEVVLTIDAVTLKLCKTCAEELRDNLTAVVGAPEE